MLSQSYLQRKDKTYPLLQKHQRSKFLLQDQKLLRKQPALQSFYLFHFQFYYYRHSFFFFVSYPVPVECYYNNCCYYCKYCYNCHYNCRYKSYHNDCHCHNHIDRNFRRFPVLYKNIYDFLPAHVLPFLLSVLHLQ